jgi:hypothetical protein
MPGAFLIGIRRRRYVKGTWHGRKKWQGKDVAGAGGEHNPPPGCGLPTPANTRNTAWQGKAWRGRARQGEEQGVAWLGRARPGMARNKAGPGLAGLGRARHGEARNMAWENVHRFSEPWGKRDARTGQAIRKGVGNGSIRGYFDGLDAADHACG